MPRNPGGEKRKEPRVDAEGRVEIVLDGSGAAVIRGLLLDTSASGFRASHAHVALPKGHTVTFRHSGASGQARVIWNRVTAEAVETGFLIV